MPRICPHCRFPFDPDWGDDALPASCPRCGGHIGEAHASDPRAGIATFLRKPAQAADAALTTREAGNKALDRGASTPDEAEAATPTVETFLDVAHADAAPAPAAAAVQSDQPAATSPGFARRSVAPAPSTRTARWQWAVLLLLLFALPLQLLLADRARLAANAGWRPLLVSLCGLLRCDLPPWHEPQAFSMIERDVQPVAGMAGVLQVRATVRTDARWAQPWPRVQLSLADADGRVLGMRDFEPREYLGRAPAGLLDTGQSAQVAFRIRETATPAAAFQFEFR